MTEDYIGGINTQIVFYFEDNKLQGGVYSFIAEHGSDNLYYQDFQDISNVLNQKYDMELYENWNNETFKNNPNQIGFALSMGHVQISETNESERTQIIHSVSADKYGDINHTIVYKNLELAKSQSESLAKDF